MHSGWVGNFTGDRDLLERSEIKIGPGVGLGSFVLLGICMFMCWRKGGGVLFLFKKISQLVATSPPNPSPPLSLHPPPFLLHYSFQNIY